MKCYICHYGQANTAFHLLLLYREKKKEQPYKTIKGCSFYINSEWERIKLSSYLPHQTIYKAIKYAQGYYGCACFMLLFLNKRIK